MKLQVYRYQTTIKVLIRNFRISNFENKKGLVSQAFFLFSF